jgi:hypothetical protein
MRKLLAFALLTAAGCLPARTLAALPQCTLPLPQSTLAAVACPCPCPCGTTGCTCPVGQCQCPVCPGKDALAQLKERAMKENRRLVVWTGTDGHMVSECLTCRDERCESMNGIRPFVSVGVPSATGLVWHQFAASVPDALLQSVRTDGTHDLLDRAAPSPYYRPSQAMSFQGGGGGFGGNCSH